MAKISTENCLKIVKDAFAANAQLSAMRASDLDVVAQRLSDNLNDEAVKGVNADFKGRAKKFLANEAKNIIGNQKAFARNIINEAKSADILKNIDAPSRDKLEVYMYGGSSKIMPLAFGGGSVYDNASLSMQSRMHELRHRYQRGYTNYIKEMGPDLEAEWKTSGKFQEDVMEAYYTLHGRANGEVTNPKAVKLAENLKNLNDEVVQNKWNAGIMTRNTDTHIFKNMEDKHALGNLGEKGFLELAKKTWNMREAFPKLYKELDSVTKKGGADVAEKIKKIHRKIDKSVMNAYDQLMKGAHSVTDRMEFVNHKAHYEYINKTGTVSAESSTFHRSMVLGLGRTAEFTSKAEYFGFDKDALKEGNVGASPYEKGFRKIESKIAKGLKGKERQQFVAETAKRENMFKAATSHPSYASGGSIGTAASTAKKVISMMHLAGSAVTQLLELPQQIFTRKTMSGENVIQATTNSIENMVKNLSKSHREQVLSHMGHVASETMETLKAQLGMTDMHSQGWFDKGFMATMKLYGLDIMANTFKAGSFENYIGGFSVSIKNWDSYSLDVKQDILKQWKKGGFDIDDVDAFKSALDSEGRITYDGIVENVDVEKIKTALIKRKKSAVNESKIKGRPSGKKGVPGKTKKEVIAETYKKIEESVNSMDDSALKRDFAGRWMRLGETIKENQTGATNPRLNSFLTGNRPIDDPLGAFLSLITQFQGPALMALEGFNSYAVSGHKTTAKSALQGMRQGDVDVFIRTGQYLGFLLTTSVGIVIINDMLKGQETDQDTLMRDALNRSGVAGIFGSLFFGEGLLQKSEVISGPVIGTAANVFQFADNSLSNLIDINTGDYKSDQFGKDLTRLIRKNTPMRNHFIAGRLVTSMLDNVQTYLYPEYRYELMKKEMEKKYGKR